MTSPSKQIVTQPQELAEVCAHLAAERSFGFDTEFVGEESYRPRLCLVQVATAERLILIDPFTAGPLDAFWKLIIDRANQVIVHAAREEVRLCHLWTGALPGQLVDLQIAAGLAGLPYPLGHGNLVDKVLGIRLPKTETLTEWRDRPLTPRQIQYAFDDVCYLLPLWRELSSRLQSLGRMDWAREEFERMNVVHADEEPERERWRRLKGLGALNRRQLAIVRELHQWREDLAARTNRPPRTLCRDDLMVEIARRNPVRERDLQVVRGLARRDAPAILEAVERARALPLEQCPEPLEREVDPAQLGLLVNVLQAALGQFCYDKQLSPSLVCSTQDLKFLVRSFLSGEVDGTSTVLDLGWRREHIRPLLEAVLRGEIGLRVAAPGREAPFEFIRRVAAGPGPSPTGGTGG
jgi:ribonuclease D